MKKQTLAPFHEELHEQNAIGTKDDIRRHHLQVKYAKTRLSTGKSNATGTDLTTIFMKATLLSTTNKNQRPKFSQTTIFTQLATLPVTQEQVIDRIQVNNI